MTQETKPQETCLTIIQRIVVTILEKVSMLLLFLKRKHWSIPFLNNVNVSRLRLFLFLFLLSLFSFLFLLYLWFTTKSRNVNPQNHHTTYLKLHHQSRPKIPPISSFFITRSIPVHHLLPIAYLFQKFSTRSERKMELKFTFFLFKKEKKVEKGQLTI